MLWGDAGCRLPNPNFSRPGADRTWFVPFVLLRLIHVCRRERDRKLYSLTGFVRVVKLQADCEFHVQVAQSREKNAPQVIVEVPHRFGAVQRELMALVAMRDGQKSKVWSDPSSAPHLRFIGFAFLDQPHQTEPPTQEGHRHGPGGVVRTLWEIHPVLKVEAVH